MARLVNGARRRDPANVDDAIDELLTTIDIMDGNPTYYICGVAARVEVALLLGRRGRITEAENALNRPLRLILAQINAEPETAPEQSVVEASLLFSATSYVDIQAARLAVERAIQCWAMAELSIRGNMPSLAKGLIAYHEEQLTVVAVRANSAIINAKAAWNYSKVTNRPDVHAFAAERLEIALKAGDEETAADLVAARRFLMGPLSPTHWIIDPDTWRF